MNIYRVPHQNYASGIVYTPGSASRTPVDSMEDLNIQGGVESGETSIALPASETETNALSVEQTEQAESQASVENSRSQAHPQASPIDAQLTEADIRLIDQLEQVDAEVKRHEMAHVAAGGSLITSGASFTYREGPDGKRYAVAGEVSIDSSAVPGDPQATRQKMQQIKRAALAPANPSAQDLKVASQATFQASKSLAELTMLMEKDRAGSSENPTSMHFKKASEAYARAEAWPEMDTSSAMRPQIRLSMG